MLSSSRDVGLMVPEVDLGKCTYCNRCADVCQYHAIAVVGEKVLTFPELCHGCGSCTLNCPPRAIHEVLRVMGSIERGDVNSLAFAQGTMDVGEPMVVINRDGVGDRGVDECCEAEDIPVLMCIPLDRRIAEAYSEGVPLVEALPEYRERFIELWGRIAGFKMES